MTTATETTPAALPPVRVEAVVRRWRFRVEDEDGTGRYVGQNGEPDSDDEWIGTDAEAARESDRRADAWENRPGSGWSLRVVRESMGKVTANAAGQGAAKPYPAPACCAVDSDGKR